ncbi:MAG: hypothetical protein A2583_10235 [Bdellovibrionales bacterium RIFOXYD1_FULL_53_11]|nr:MAG: hypothetical protein A2583_10235 [Bdellovibrionales bacterium RIFOXYD1_FULL_53_11]
MAKTPSITVSASLPACDTAMIPVFQDKSKKAVPPAGIYSKAVSAVKKAGKFNAKCGSLDFIRFGGRKPAANLLLAGFGRPAALTAEKARSAGAHAWSKLAAEKSTTAAFSADLFLAAKGLGHDAAELLGAFAEGLSLASYKFDKYKSKKESAKDRPAKIIFAVRDKKNATRLSAALVRARAISEAVNLARDWSNEPSNTGTPEHFAAEAAKIAKSTGIKCLVLGPKEIAKERMDLLLAVNQGSRREPRVVVLEYAPKDAAKCKTVALVGKGVTFDSGGISIKPSLRMEDMKHDMSGASTIMGAVLLSARLKVPNRVLGVMAFVENMPGGAAVQPGNIIKARSGKTVEIINTDAEGRLILADALDYTQDLGPHKPDIIIDAATLTGAVSVALGKQCCAALGNDDKLFEAVRDAGSDCGERIWQLPLYDEYFEDMKSDAADMKNSCNDANGGTIRGAIFLKQFIRPKTRWVHLDIAAMAYGAAHIDYHPKRGASGMYVRTLARLAETYGQDQKTRGVKNDA